MKTILDVLTVFNAVIVAALVFKLVGARRQERRLEVAIGEAKASISE